MIKIEIEIEPKKGDRIKTIWGIRQVAPCPDFEGCAGSFRWRNCSELMPPWRPAGQETKPTIGEWYECDLLRNDIAEHNLDTRESHAGWLKDDWRRDGEAPTPAPGSFSLRGVFLGEVGVTYERGFWYAKIRVRGYNDPTPGERDFFMEKICPHLKAAIEKNREVLKTEAIAELTARVKRTIAEGRTKLDKLETEMLAAIEAAAK